MEVDWASGQTEEWSKSISEWTPVEQPKEDGGVMDMKGKMGTRPVSIPGAVPLGKRSFATWKVSKPFTGGIYRRMGALIQGPVSPEDMFSELRAVVGI
ncbi:unnamed protein product [Nezara viridula]|uniref:Uncharacterized protein n=1 Tax=Nezara viridula TaxID=85310 RepID=A0A9P0H2J2_NEZVI|nr:unnamed protein product [Nezara viridula]